MTKNQKEPDMNNAGGFAGLKLRTELLGALDALGYETPSPIQREIIPHVLAGRDVIGQAQTGSGKTAAFALPILSRLDLREPDPQALVLTPTRELAIQVAEAFQKYASRLPGFHVAPIYGGQGYETQLRQLHRGVHVVVGTPGRVMDHMKRGSLKLTSLTALVLDEADEMLRMGFIDDVEWILQRTPEQRQVALFSATMPGVIKRIAQTHIPDALEITVRQSKQNTPEIRQRHWMVQGMSKLEALTRLLETENFDGILIFTRTKIATVELADKLEARGHAAVALNGDMDQKARERTVEQFKRGKLDILVATDVVARGIDVDRVSHVVNYDMPHDTESYVHRIGRTGRAGRSGDAILFVAPREKRMLYSIERATGHRIPAVELPTIDNINETRVARFKQRLSDTMETANLGLFREVIGEFVEQHDADPIVVAAALAHQLQGEVPLLLSERPRKTRRNAKSDTVDKPGTPPAAAKNQASRPAKPPSPDSELFRLEVGRDHGAEPANIIGAIANEAGLDNEHIGKLEMHDDHSIIELPLGMPRDIFRDLKKAWVAGRQLRISRVADGKPGKAGPSKKPARPKKAKAGKKGKRAKVRKP